METERMRAALEKKVDQLKSDMDKGRFDYQSNAGVLRVCCKEILEAYDSAALASSEGPSQQQAFRDKYRGICPCCRNEGVTDNDKGKGVPCPYCVTGELSWKLPAPTFEEPLREELRDIVEYDRDKLWCDVLFNKEEEDGVKVLTTPEGGKRIMENLIEARLAEWKRRFDESSAEFAILSRACGNWRTWPNETESDHEHPDWQVAAKAILERNELRAAPPPTASFRTRDEWRTIIVGLPIVRKLLTGEDVSLETFKVSLIPDDVLFNAKPTAEKLAGEQKRTCEHED